MADKIKQLAKKLIKARHAYYNGEPLISDAAYDKLEAELKNLAPDHPAITNIGAPIGVTEWEKAKHDIPMTSLNKVNTPEELRDWAKKCAIK